MAGTVELMMGTGPDNNTQAKPSDDFFKLSVGDEPPDHSDDDDPEAFVTQAAEGNVAAVVRILSRNAPDAGSDELPWSDFRVRGLQAAAQNGHAAVVWEILVACRGTVPAPVRRPRPPTHLVARGRLDRAPRQSPSRAASDEKDC